MEMLPRVVRVRVAVPPTVPAVTILPVLVIMKTEIVVLVPPNLEECLFDPCRNVPVIVPEYERVRRKFRQTIYCLESLTPRQSATNPIESVVINGRCLLVRLTISVVRHRYD